MTFDLSRFDTRVNKFNKERTDLVEIARGCIRQNKVVAEGREQKIVFDDPLIPMYIYADGKSKSGYNKHYFKCYEIQ